MTDETLMEAVRKGELAKRLRTALGDDARAPRYIETLPRRGYRWINAAIPLDNGPDRSGRMAHDGDEPIEIVWT